MGQAKQRKDEINKLKNLKLVRFGAFYKDNLDEGFSITFDNVQVPNLQMFSDGVMNMANGYHEQVGKCPEWPTKAAMIDDLKAQTEKELIPFLNNYMYGTPTQPAKGHYQIRIDPDHPELMPAIICFMANVAFLQDVGVVKNDNHNGMLFVKSS